MSEARVQRKTFFWQAALILLPVAVLAVIGWASLRQDKILAEHDARERAQVVADQLLPVMSAELTANGSSNQVTLQIDDTGQLLFPPPYHSTPEPQPFSLDDLSPEQTRLWAASEKATNSVAEAIAARQHFIESKPPERFAAAAHYELVLLLLQQNKLTEAEDSLDSVSADAVGESGLPLKPLALFKMLQLQPFSLDTGVKQYKLVQSPGRARQNHADAQEFWTNAKHFIPLDSFCSNIVYHPSVLTPFLLNQAAAWFNPPPPNLTLATNAAMMPSLAGRENQLAIVHKWQSVWEEHERAREIFAAAREHLHTNSFTLLPVGTNKTEVASIGPDIFWFPFPEVQKKWTDTTADARMITSEQNWIAARASSGTNGASFICRPESEFGSSLWKNTRRIPSYFSVGLEVAGKRIIQGAPVLKYWHEDYVAVGAKGAGQHWEKTYSGRSSTNLLAAATQSKNGEEQVRVEVYLTSPQELFATQQSRVLAFGLLVIASTVAALIGLFAAWKAFHRQLHLAEMKSNFVSSVSHELRAPIASVRLMAESLERGKIDGQQKQNEYFRFIGQECRRLSSLIENVLDFSRIEQGRKQYEFEPTDLLALTRETVKLMEPYAEEKGVRLETSNTEHRTPNIEVEVDGRAIQQALVNLIDNAIKHSAKGQVVTIGIEVPGAECQVSGENASTANNLTPDTSHLTPGPSYLALYVEDHGAGIPPAEHEKIFERFYRLGSELRRETQGVGIGLSIVKHIVEAHGGRVTVRSNIGQGSRFTIELPGVNAKTQSSKGAKDL